MILDFEMAYWVIFISIKEVDNPFLDLRFIIRNISIWQTMLQ